MEGQKCIVLEQTRENYGINPSWIWPLVSGQPTTVKSIILWRRANGNQFRDCVLVAICHLPFAICHCYCYAKHHLRFSVNKARGLRVQAVLLIVSKSTAAAAGQYFTQKAVELPTLFSYCRGSL